MSGTTPFISPARCPIRLVNGPKRKSTLLLPITSALCACRYCVAERSQLTIALISRARSSSTRAWRKYFPGKDPISQQIDDNQSDEKNPPPLTIVGVVPRTRSEAAGEDNVEQYRWPQMTFAAEQVPNRSNMLVVRVKSGNPLALVPAIKRELQALDPDQAFVDISTMENNIAKSLGSRRMMMSLLGAFAGIALLLASVGLYGVMALTVTQRTRELGIRLALGAQRADVFRLVLSQGMLLVVSGLIIGLVGTLGVGRGLKSVLYGVGGSDALALSFALFALAIVALIACWLPARRATRVDPIVALRAE